MLKTEQNTAAMENRVLAAACARFGTDGFDAAFEHGQWWVTNLDTGAQYSVVDASGGNSVDGFDFEQATQGDEE